MFGTKDALVVEFVRNDSAAEAARYGVRVPFYTAHYDFVLQRAATPNAVSTG